jgi:glycopeptide antibiotics resistance protein
MLDGRWLYVAAIPVVVAIVGRRGVSGRAVIALVALAHVVVLANVALFPIPVDQGLHGDAWTASSAGGGLNLVPFATIGPVLAGHASSPATRIAVLNLFVLAPAGIYLPALFRLLRSWPGLVIVAFVGGLSVEAAQLGISTILGVRYRTIDVDDVILNTIGIVVGWLVARAALILARAGSGSPGTRSPAHPRWIGRPRVSERRPGGQDEHVRPAAPSGIRLEPSSDRPLAAPPAHGHPRRPGSADARSSTLERLTPAAPSSVRVAGHPVPARAQQEVEIRARVGLQDVIDVQALPATTRGG